MTQYKTLEAQQSAAKVITGCIDAINNEKGLPYQLGTLTVDYITKYLAEYRKLIEKDIEESQKAAEAAGDAETVIKIWAANKENGYRAYPPEFEVMFWNAAGEALRIPDGKVNHEYQTKFGFDTFEEAALFIESVNVPDAVQVSINDECYDVYPKELQVKGNKMQERSRLSFDGVRSFCISKNLYTRGNNEEYTRLANMLFYWQETGQNIDTAKLQIVAQNILDHSDTEYELESLMFSLKREAVITSYCVADH